MVNGLPEPLTPASRHLQIFDNYIENTRLRLRTIRVPEDKSWEWILEQRIFENGASVGVLSISRIFLSETEHQVFEVFEGREIRKNRYFFKSHDLHLEFDVYLGKLWGLNIMNVRSERPLEIQDPKVDDLIVKEVTDIDFFTGEILVGKTFEDVQNKFQEL